jgi:hypothetical protein
MFVLLIKITHHMRLIDTLGKAKLSTNTRPAGGKVRGKLDVKGHGQRACPTRIVGISGLRWPLKILLFLE